MLVQVESKAGLENLDEIARVEGIDGVFIGPSDLAASFGLIGKPGHPEVQKAIADAVKTIAAAGKPSGILTMNTDEAQKYIDMGVCFVAVGADVAVLTDGARALAKRFKAPIPE